MVGYGSGLQPLLRDLTLAPVWLASECVDVLTRNKAGKGHQAYANTKASRTGSVHPVLSPVLSVHPKLSLGPKKGALVRLLCYK